MKYLSLKEYENIARKILTHTHRRIANVILKDNDKFGQIVSELIIADQKFDSRGTLEGYRKQRVAWIIPKLFGKKSSTQYIEEISPGKLPSCKDNVERDVLFNESLELFIEKIKNNNKLSSKEQICIERHFIEGASLDLIAKDLNITKTMVKRHIKKATIKLGVYGEYTKRL